MVLFPACLWDRGGRQGEIFILVTLARQVSHLCTGKRVARIPFMREYHIITEYTVITRHRILDLGLQASLLVPTAHIPLRCREVTRMTLTSEKLCE